MRKLLFVAAFLFLGLTRPYWIVDPTVYATNGSIHTHVQITGFVQYTAVEDDGDLHIRIGAATAGSYFIAECIPSLTCQRPAVGARVTVRGITRRDPEHGWREVHPVESITVIQ